MFLLFGVFRVRLITISKI